MGWIETVLVTCGISLDVFAMVARKGAQMSHISKNVLTKLCLFVVLVQTIALYIGIAAGRMLYQKDAAMLDNTTEILAGVIFGVLGLIRILQYRKKELITERLDNEISWKKVLDHISIIVISTLVIGVALGFLGTPIILALFMIAFTLVVVVLGLYIGFHYGYEWRAKLSLISGSLFFLAALDTVLRHVM